jgi:hypothetical protein
MWSLKRTKILLLVTAVFFTILNVSVLPVHNTSVQDTAAELETSSVASGAPVWAVKNIDATTSRFFRFIQESQNPATCKGKHFLVYQMPKHGDGDTRNVGIDLTLHS